MFIKLVPPISGSILSNYWKVLHDNKFKIDLQYLSRFLYTSLISTLAITPVSLYEKVRKQKQIDHTPIPKAPVFIIGHWRSGTTFLHYLMAQDKQFGYINCAQSFCPGKMFHSSFSLIKKLIGIHLPNKRPVDDLALGLELPQEEEFALGNTSPHSCYHWWSFPKQMKSYFKKYALLKNLSTTEYQSFQQAYFKLLQKVSAVNNSKRLLLKNPVNTGRIPFLLELFPNAQFIYIHRNPNDVYHSTIKLHTSFLANFSFQNISKKEIEQNTLNFYKQLLHKYEHDKLNIPSSNLIEIDYQRLIQLPLETLKEIYQKIHIPHFEQAQNAFQQFIKKQENYRADTYLKNPQIEHRLKKCLEII